MRRRPEEYDQEQQHRLEANRAGSCGPTNHRRECPGRAADDDILRRRSLKPHGVDRDIEEDREGKERGSKPIGNEAQHRN
jgi:hypothetical protein